MIVFVLLVAAIRGSVVSEGAGFFTGDPGLFREWTQTLPDDIQESFDFNKEPFGFVFLRVEERLFGRIGGARLAVDAVASIYGEEEQFALFRCVFLLEILRDLNKLKNEDGQLSETATNNLTIIAHESGYELEYIMPIISLVQPFNGGP